MEQYVNKNSPDTKCAVFFDLDAEASICHILFDASIVPDQYVYISLVSPLSESVSDFL